MNKYRGMHRVNGFLEQIVTVIFEMAVRLFPNIIISKKSHSKIKEDLAMRCIYN